MIGHVSPISVLYFDSTNSKRRLHYHAESKVS